MAVRVRQTGRAYRQGQGAANMTETRHRFAGVVLAAAIVGLTGASASAQTVTLVGASQFDENHAFTKTMRKFEELVQQCYTE
jgi:TRAP-type C4-dicarboxylate transport system substrate-binding protein